MRVQLGNHALGPSLSMLETTDQADRRSIVEFKRRILRCYNLHFTEIMIIILILSSGRIPMHEAVTGINADKSKHISKLL